MAIPESPSSELEGSSVVEILQTLQSSIDGQFTKVTSTLGEISDRLNALEEKQKCIEEKIEMGSAGSSPASTPQSNSSECGMQRKRRTPVSLQVY